MATPKSQRIGIWVIAVVMLVGTIGSFAVMVLANENSQSDRDQQSKLLEEYQKQQKEKQAKADAEAAEFSAKYYSKFAKYQHDPAAFDADKVGDTVATKDLAVGDGAKIKEDTTYKAYYIGWNPKGAVFDSSLDGKKLKAPFDTGMFSPIKGWKQGVVGMKTGGVREITIPSDLAYGEAGQGNDIPPNTPIKFIVMVIATN